MPRSFGITNAAPYASAPTAGAAGDVYWNTGEKALYGSDGTAWNKVGPVPAIATIGTTAPTTPAVGQLWWRSDMGRLMIWYDDGNSQQWVPVVPV